MTDVESIKNIGPINRGDVLVVSRVDHGPFGFKEMLDDARRVAGHDQFLLVALHADWTLDKLTIHDLRGLVADLEAKMEAAS